MAYKDKEKQKQAVKEATRRYRAKNKDSALSGQKQVLKNARGLPKADEVGDTQPAIPSNVIPVQADDVIPSIIPERQSHSPMMVGYVPPKE